jgi:UDP-2,3-diacylglucosamine hydrolase
MTWVLADPHAGGDIEADRRLFELLSASESSTASLLLMGDLFVAWTGVDRFLTGLQRHVLGRLQAIRLAGGRVRLVVGNRDYLAERLVGTSFDEVLADEAVIDLDGVPTLVAHGDRLNPNDRRYLAWHRASRSRIATSLFERLPARAGRKLTSEIERRMRGTNLAYKTGAVPMDGIAGIAERAKARGAVRVLLGHFHEPQTIAAAVPVVIAPGWIEHSVILDGRTLAPIDPF